MLDELVAPIWTVARA
jgi:hypothetical protein